MTARIVDAPVSRTYTRKEMEAAFDAGYDHATWCWRDGNDDREPPDFDEFIVSLESGPP